jgi:MraZ protein
VGKSGGKWEKILMFLGAYQVRIDAKGRINIPAKHREILHTTYGSDLVLTSFDHCIDVYPRSEWTLLTQQLQKLPSLKRDVRMFMRTLFAATHECPLDNQGRILIPPPLRERAGLRSEVMVLGVNNRLEIWDKERWEGYYRSGQEQIEEIADRLAELNFERGQLIAEQEP